jgi:hypothetical protein
VQLPAGADAELGVDLAQVVFDGAGGQEQLRPDLRVRPAVAGQPGDEGLLGGQLDGALDGAPGHGRAGGEQFPAGALGEPGHAQPGQQLVRGAELLAGGGPAARAAQPFPV